MCGSVPRETLICKIYLGLVMLVWLYNLMNCFRVKEARESEVRHAWATGCNGRLEARLRSSNGQVFLCHKVE